jgi:membrane-bound inhibitor of C-type lysozyme
MTQSHTRRARRGVTLAALALGCVLAPAAAQADDGWQVVTYRCDNNNHIVIAYPPDRDTSREPIRVTWQGRTVRLSPVSGFLSTGRRYNSPMADLEWWDKRNTGSTLSRNRNTRTILTNCVPF